MADSFSLSVVPSCAAGSGVLDCAGGFTAGNPQEVSTTLLCELSRAGTVLAELPLDRNGICQFSGLADGAYALRWYGQETGNTLGTASTTVTCAAPLVFDSFTATDATASRATGTLSGQAHGGTGALTVVIVELGLRQAITAGVAFTFPNIPAGTYTARVSDSASPAQQVSLQATVHGYAAPPDPNAPPAPTGPPAPRTPYFELPIAQSLRFVQPGRLDRPAFDNTLLADERPLDYNGLAYCQLVETGDTLVLQALSNYVNAPVLTLNNAGGVLLSVTGQRVHQGAGTSAAFDAYYKADTTGGQTRAYFNAEALPLPFAVGQVVTVAGTGTVLDGDYPITSVLEDAAAAVPYLVLPVAYPSGAMRLSGTLRTAYRVQAFDTWQFVVPFATVPAGGCYARVTATDPGLPNALAVSEPISVAVRHVTALQLTYRNFDNAYGLNYSAGLVNRLRVPGRFFERLPSATKDVLRNDDNRLVLLYAQVQRKVQLETLLLPGWLHEKLALALAHDFVKVEGVRVVSEGEYAHEPVSRYGLSRGTALLEAVDFLDSTNRDDLGDVDAGGGPFLLAANNFLLARR
jgi:hypothetical protein